MTFINRFFAASLLLTATICVGQTFTINTVAGDGVQGFSGDNGLAVNAEIFTLALVALDSAGNLYIADTGNCRIRKVTKATGVITTVAGVSTCGYAGDHGLATSAQLNFPKGVAVDSAGEIFIGDTGNSVIRKVDTNGVITTFAGMGTAGYSGDTGLAVNAQLSLPAGLAFDASGALYIADAANHVVRKVALNGIITTVAGTGTAGFTGNGGQATSAELYAPNSVTFDTAGTMYIAEPPNNAVRKVSTSGIISLIVGTGFGNPGFSGDTGLAINASVNDPQAVAVDTNGYLYIADEDNQRIRMITPGGIISTICGDGTKNYSGDGGPSTSAEIWLPEGIAVGPTGAVYFLDSANNRVRALTPVGTTQTITFNPLSNVDLGVSPFALSASASSGLPVGFASITPSVCTVSGATATVVGLGTCSITASQLGNATYAPAVAVTQSFTVFAAVGTVTLSAPANGTTGVSVTPTLSWSATSGATSYDVYFGTSASPGFLTNTSATSYAPSTLLPNQTYYWQIVAKNGGGSSSSSVWSFTTLPATISPVGVSPAAGNAAAQTFTFTFTDPNGYADLFVLDVLISTFLDGQTACYFALAPTSATTGYIYLVDDAGDGGYAGAPMPLPSAGLVQNSQCAISATGSSVSASGNTLTLTLAITFKAPFEGNKAVYMAARSNTQNSGWQALGTWDVPGAAFVGPAVGTVSPARSTSMGQTYTFTFTDSNGFADLFVLDVLTNSFLVGNNGCYFAYVPTTPTNGYLYLVDDAGDGGYAPGSPIGLSSGGSLQNNQCVLNTTGSSALASGNTLTLNLPITFKAGFAGNQVFFLAARNNSTGNSGWQAAGSVTVP
jgi:sugar lactone lactonase YvrE